MRFGEHTVTSATQTGELAARAEPYGGCLFPLAGTPRVQFIGPIDSIYPPRPSQTT